MRIPYSRTAVGIVAATVTLAFSALWAADSPRPERQDLESAIAGLDRTGLTTGILYDLIVPFSHIGEYGGGEAASICTRAEWRQVYSEMWRASLAQPSWPSPAELEERRTAARRSSVLRLALMNFSFNRIRPDAFDAGALTLRDGRLIEGEGLAFTEQRVFALTTLEDHTYRGQIVVFGLDPAWYFTNDGRHPVEVGIDFADGKGFRSMGFGEECAVNYSSIGRKTIRAKLALDDGTVLQASSYFDVRSLATPTPDDTLSITATIPYGGSYGTGQAYVYLSGLHSQLTNPVIVPEGFDMYNDMNWEELYALLNQQNLVERLRADGYDAVVLNFADATDYIQKNAYVIVQLIEQVKSLVSPSSTLAVVGPSMGGLAGRFALAYMETNGLDHRVRTFISFDSPQKGANIPLGIQYWMSFYSSQSEAAAELLSRLNTPASRQMLVYHLTSPPGSTGQSDPIRATFLSDLAAAGGYPVDLRKVAVANGSGSMVGQGFPAGDQIVFYEYYSFLVDLIGNVWAVPEGANQRIFQGLIDRIWPLPDDQLNVYVSGTAPYDNAPGGWRSSMAQMDSTPAPYGDIIALHPSHCFIPTISSLDLDTDNLFLDIAGTPDLLAHTPFDTLYYPADNQEHVTITAESAEWFIDEIERGSTAGVPKADHPGGAASLALSAASPNPCRGATSIRYFLPRAQQVHAGIYGASGRQIATLFDGVLAAGPGVLAWSGADSGGNRVAPGTYFCRLVCRDGARTTTVVVAR